LSPPPAGTGPQSIAQRAESIAGMPEPRARLDGYVPYRGLPRWQTVDMALLDVREGLAVLDVGCGAGYLLGKAAGRASLAVGVDLDQDRLRAARDGLLHEERPSRGLIEFAVADGQRLPFGDASFDRIICTETLEHVSDAQLTLCELARVLRPGGRLAVSVPNFASEAILYRLIKDYFRFPGGHRRIFSPQALHRALARAGLQPYATCLRDSLEAAYWILFSLLSRPPRRFTGMLTGLERWRARTRGQPYSRFYHAVDEVGNRLLPKSVVVYALKPAGWAARPDGPLAGRAR
jgi:ubiquinone/menaquinone biosynthesis C-methylase UbiE